MAFAAFDVHDEVAFSAVVFARDGDQALCIALEHRASFRGSTGSPMTMMERLPALGGRARDHQLAAVDAGITGVGYPQADGSWLVLPPGIQPIHTVRPTPTRMFHFSDDDGYEVVLFAHEQERASDLYNAIRSDYRVLPREWRGSEFETWSAIGLVRHQAQAEDRGTEGIGIYNPDGWLLLPIDYDRLGVAPPE
jgi:hypothetical protein